VLPRTLTRSLSRTASDGAFIARPRDKGSETVGTEVADRDNTPPTCRQIRVPRLPQLSLAYFKSETKTGVRSELSRERDFRKIVLS